MNNKEVYIRYVNPYQNMSRFKKFLRFFVDDSIYQKCKEQNIIFEIETTSQFLDRLLKEINNLGEPTTVYKGFKEKEHKLIDNDIFRVVIDNSPPFISNIIITIEPIFISDKSTYEPNKQYRLIISSINSKRFQYLTDDKVKKIIRKNKLNKLKSL